GSNVVRNNTMPAKATHVERQTIAAPKGTRPAATILKGGAGHPAARAAQQQLCKPIDRYGPRVRSRSGVPRSAIGAEYIKLFDIRFVCSKGKARVERIA